MEREQGNGDPPRTTTDAAAQMWPNSEAVAGLRLVGTNVEHHFPSDFTLLRIGKDPRADIRIDHPSVSRKHATIERRGPHLVVVDQDSKNHTWVDGQPQQIFHLLAGAVVRFGSVDTMLFNTRTQTVRAGIRRFLGYSESAQRSVDSLQYTAARRRHVGLLGPPGRGATLLARFLHDTTPGGATWPYLLAGDVSADEDEQIALAASAAYGTLVVEVHRLPERPAVLFDRIVNCHVRLVLLANDKELLDPVLVEYLRNELAIFSLPSLASRVGEVEQVINETAAGQASRAGAADSGLRRDDVLALATCVLEPRGGRKRIQDHDELDEVVRRLMFLRQAGGISEAERQLGLSRGALSKWAAKYGLEPR